MDAERALNGNEPSHNTQTGGYPAQAMHTQFYQGLKSKFGTPNPHSVNVDAHSWWQNGYDTAHPNNELDPVEYLRGNWESKQAYAVQKRGEWACTTNRRWLNFNEELDYNVCDISTRTRVPWVLSEQWQAQLGEERGTATRTKMIDYRGYPLVDGNSCDVCNYQRSDIFPYCQGINYIYSSQGIEVLDNGYYEQRRVVNEIQDKPDLFYHDDGNTYPQYPLACTIEIELLTPVATGYMHENQAYFEVWLGEECLDGGLLFWMGQEERQELDPAFTAFCQALEEPDEDLVLKMLCDLADLCEPEIQPSYFISWYCLSLHLKTTFNLIARCYCRISISTSAGYEEVQEYYASKHMEAMEYSFKSSGLMPEVLVCSDSFPSSDDDSFFFRFIEMTQIISHSVDLSFIDGFSADFESLFEVSDRTIESEDDLEQEAIIDNIRSTIVPQW